MSGAPFLMAPLARELRGCRIQPLFAFSEHESLEEKQPDGSVVKGVVFRHDGFVEMESS